MVILDVLLLFGIGTIVYFLMKFIDKKTHLKDGRRIPKH